MKKSTFLVLTILINISLAFGAEKPNSIKGTLTVNDVDFQLKYIYINEQFGDELIICMLDKPVTKDKCPDYLTQIAEQGETHGLSIGISKAEKQLFKDSYSNYIFYNFDTGTGSKYNSNVGDLTINVLNDTVLEARLILEKSGIFSCYECDEDHTYSYDVTFNVHLGNGSVGLGNGDGKVPKSINIKVTGDDTAVGKAYSDYYKAKMTGDIDAFKKSLPKQHLNELEGEQAEMMLRMSMMLDPKIINIEKTEMLGTSSAVLTVIGTENGKKVATGHVEMIFEDGQWKVAMDKWQLASK